MIVSSGEVLAALTNIIRWRQDGTSQIAAGVRPGQEEIGRCRAAIRALPAVRPERVCRIKDAVDTARYRIDDYQVATKMVERSLVDSLYATVV